MQYKIIRVIELWDGLLFEISNFVRYVLDIFDQDGGWFANSNLKDKYNGEACYIVLNNQVLKILIYIT